MASEKRLIDANAFGKSIQLSIASWSVDCNSNAPTIVRTYKDVLARLGYAPTVDAVEVVHGQWIYHECVSSYDGAISGYSCSECCIFVDEEIFDMDEFHKDFCGHCGAKMDGRNENG